MNDIDVSGDILWEISLDSKNTIIKNRFDGIEFIFCLLNEKGMPSTRFKQGEKFSLYFVLTNHRKDKLYTISDFGCMLPTHCTQLITLDKDSIHYSFVRYPCHLPLLYQPFYGRNNKRELNEYWIDKQTYQFPNLPEGEYYTDFSCEFIFSHNKANKPFYKLNTITFKINFKIENNEENYYY